MSRRRRDTIVSALSLVLVVVLVVSPAAAALRKALRSSNAGTVSGVKASLTPRANSLVPLDPAGRLPRTTLPPGTAVRGAAGAKGPVGALGRQGPPGLDGPGATTVYRNAKVYGPEPANFDFTLATAKNLAPGSYFVWATARLRRGDGGEFLAGCKLTNGLRTTAGSIIAIGRQPGFTGTLEATSFVAGVFASDLPQDISLDCDGTLFGSPAGPSEIAEPTLIVARIPSASAQLTGS